MFLRSAFNRLAIATAAGALITSVVATPALADDEWDEGGGDPGFSQQDDRGDWDHGEHHNNPRLYRGVVTASELFLRSAPNRGSQVIRVAYRGERVSIFCKTVGQNIQGNNRWYLLTDGTWAWGSARYIDTIGPTPRWC
ncbi:SH3 domain-containing protein [Streptomyces cylindrosporus]|uniref:SH3 domain-containing protein n=1 Tax=Streptomyces cylindrosporus TaxID=2927583 RepID=A0ABS9Y790_9ACTN|nr:SH3 domain-containing protein [Streptomyces cylindrosporus]MCI3273092.1 SH3 domain-containing protein [Streptomyces cylindrosporus]